MNQKTMILSALGIAAAASLFYGIFSSSKSRAPKSPAVSGIAAQNSQTDATILAPSSLEFIERRSPKASKQDWGRNPFYSGSFSEKAPRGYTLSGIVWDRTAPKAIVNGQVHGVGDALDDTYRVSQIQKTTVLLESSDGSTLELTLG